MDRPPQARSVSKPANLSSVIDVNKLDRFFKILQEKKFEPNYKEYVFIARRLYMHDDILSQFAARHKISKPEMKELLENFLNLATQDLYKTSFAKIEISEQFKKEGITQEQANAILALFSLIEEYNDAQSYDDTKAGKFLPSRTRQELELISKNVNAAFTDKVVLRGVLKSFALALPVLKNFQSQSAELLAANPVQQKPAAITKKQQQNADYIYQIYQEARNDFDTYLQLKPSNKLDRIRTYVEETRNPVMQTYLLQKMSQDEVNNFSHLYYKISDILKARSKSKQIPNGLTENQQLLYTFLDRYIKEGDKYTLNLTDQNKNSIQEAAQAIIKDQDAFNKLARWLLVKPNVLTIILGKISDMFKNKQLYPWPDYPEESSSEQPAALPKLPVIQEQSRVFSMQDFINYALDNNAKLNALIKDSSGEQLQTVLSNVNALIAADEKVVRKYQERFEVTPRQDLAKLRLLVQTIDQELIRRKEEKEAFLRQNINKPHPEYPESPR
jgi:hypothetical protein